MSPWRVARTELELHRGDVVVHVEHGGGARTEGSSRNSRYICRRTVGQDRVVPGRREPHAVIAGCAASGPTLPSPLRICADVDLQAHPQAAPGGRSADQVGHRGQADQRVPHQFMAMYQDSRCSTRQCNRLPAVACSEHPSVHRTPTPRCRDRSAPTTSRCHERPRRCRRQPLWLRQPTTAAACVRSTSMRAVHTELSKAVPGPAPFAPTDPVRPSSVNSTDLYRRSCRCVMRPVVSKPSSMARASIGCRRGVAVATSRSL